MTTTKTLMGVSLAGELSSKDKEDIERDLKRFNQAPIAPTKWQKFVGPTFAPNLKQFVPPTHWLPEMQFRHKGRGKRMRPLTGHELVCRQNPTLTIATLALLSSLLPTYRSAPIMYQALVSCTVLLTLYLAYLNYRYDRIILRSEHLARFSPRNKLLLEATFADIRGFETTGPSLLVAVGWPSGKAGIEVIDLSSYSHLDHLRYRIAELQPDSALANTSHA